MTPKDTRGSVESSFKPAAGELLVLVETSRKRGAVQTVTYPTSSVGNRHLDLRYFKTREYNKRLLLVVSHIPTNLNVADMFTIPLLFSQLNKFRGIWG